MRRRAVAVALATSAAILWSASGALGATKTVFAGPPVNKAPKGVPGDADTNAFYRRNVTIHPGDKIKWKFQGFHAVAIPAKGDAPPTLAVPDSANPVSDVVDEAGNPFWFNGQPSILFNPLAANRTGGTTYTGKKLLTSGAPVAGPPKPYTVRFTKPGRYRYFCPIHLGNPSMSGTVKVKRGKIPSAKRDRKAIKRQFSHAVKQIKRDDRRKPPKGDVVDMGVDGTTSTLFRFSPAKKTVNVGDTVTFRMSTHTSETHTVSFGPESYLTSLANNFISPGAGGTFVLAAQGVYPSDVPALVHTAAVHGNGFVNTGALNRYADDPLPGSQRVTFNQAGTYDYICLIHPFMHGRIVVK